MGQIDQGAAKTKSHPSPAQKANEAQAAARSPSNERLAGAQANQVDTMTGAQTGKPDPNSFLAMLRAEIEKVMPKNLDESDKFMEGGQKEGLKSAVSGNVNEQRDQAAGQLQATSSQPPNPASVPERQATPVPAEPAAPPPAVKTEDAMPASKPAAEVAKPGQDAKQSADKQMQQADITPTQMSKANDPRFTAVLDKKSTVAKVADSGPAKFKVNEQKTLTEAANQARNDGKQGLAAFSLVKGKAATSVKSRQQIAKEKDEARRKEVTDNIEKIFAKTKQTVDAKLASLDTDVSSLFDAGAEAALNSMKTYTQTEIKRFKDERYSGIIGKGRWIADLFKPVPPEIKRILEQGRKLFTQLMDALVVRIANLVETRLKDAKSEIDKGQAAIKAYVASLPRDLQAVGRAAQQEMASRFDELRNGVDEKKNQLAQKLAERYKKAHDDADSALKKMEEENKGALSGLVEAIGEVLKVLTEFKNKIMALIRKGQETIKIIVADPIAFLKNLLAAIKGGLSKFIDNIWTHLKNAFMQWLFGSLAEAGIEIPQDLTLPSILKLVLSVLGITYERMRAKAVKLIGERNVAIIEKLVEYLKALITGGPAALWEKVKEDLSNLKAMVIEAIQNWLIETLVKKAITKIVSMFNPVGAIIQAIITIYDVVIFVVEKAKQIMAFVEAIINSVHAIATGAIGGAIDWIEKSLARILPLLIGFLAQLLGLGGISKKIKEFILKVQTAVDKAIDKAIDKIVQLVKKLFGKGGKQEPAQPAKGADKVTVTLTMSGQTHRLEASAQNGKLQVQMASDRLEALRALITAARKETEHHGNRANIHNQLNDLETNLKTVEEMRLVSDKAIDDRTIAEAQKKLQKVANSLERMGQTYHIQSLKRLPHPSTKYVDTQVDGYLLKPEYQKRVRDVFYGDYDKNAKQWFRGKLQALRLLAQGRTPKPKNTLAYVDESDGQVKDWLGNTNDRLEPTVDHKKKVSRHWNSDGHNSKHKVRTDFYSATGDLQIVSRSNNSSDGAKDKTEYQPQVGKEFRGPDDPQN